MTAFDRIAVLFLHNEQGALVGWYYHPNREAIDGKRREIEADPSLANCRVSVVEYARVTDEEPAKGGENTKGH